MVLKGLGTKTWDERPRFRVVISSKDEITTFLFWFSRSHVKWIHSAVNKLSNALLDHIMLPVLVLCTGWGR
jgi:hypothetical protein